MAIPESDKPVWLSGMDDETLARLAIDLTTIICRPTFGSASKRQVEIGLFELLYPLRPEWRTVEGVAEDLAISRTRARSLVQEFHNRRVGRGGRGERKAILRDAVALWPTRPVSQKDGKLQVVVDDPFIRDLLKNFASARSIPVDWSFSDELLTFEWSAYGQLLTALHNDGRVMTHDDFLDVTATVRDQLELAAAVNKKVQAEVDNRLSEIEEEIAKVRASKGGKYVERSKAFIEKWGPTIAGLVLA